jgi:polyisoprenoid-binding protein YceI
VKLLYGLIAGAAAAIVAALVQLPLHSPDDAVFNSGTVAIAALVAGVYLGALWTFLSRAPNGLMMYLGAAVLTFAVVAVAAVAGESQLERSVSFIVPLAALVFAIATPLVVLFGMAPLPRMAELGGAGAGVVSALAIGLGLAGMGDSESGELSLPDVQADPTAAAGPLTPDDVAGVAYTVGAGSELTYTVREKLAQLPTESDAVGRTNALMGTLQLDGTSEITVDMSTLESDQDRRDNYVRNTTFGPDPIVTFTLDGVTLPETYTAGETYTASVTGNVTILGNAAPITFAVEAQLEGDQLSILGTTDFTWDDYGIPRPSVPGITVQDNIHIEVLLIATAAA